MARAMGWGLAGEELAGGGPEDTKCSENATGGIKGASCAEVSVAILQTSNCHAYKHPEFRVTYDPAIVPVEGDVRWFIDWLEQSVAQSKRFAPGQTCQIGWMVTEIRQADLTG